MNLKIYTDGGSRNNPGPAAVGIVIKDEQDKVLKKFSKYLGKKTNNQAEYLGVIEALKTAKKLKADVINLYLDSQLVVEQLNRKFKIKNEKLAPLFILVWNLSLGFKEVKYNFIPREENKEADFLVNECLDKYK
jgi:ribonuclease HI